MPLYMDRHEAGGATPEDVAAAHLKDMKVQGKYDVNFITYWFDQNADRIFCLADAPHIEAVETVHREAHGLVASEIMEVNPGLIADFLGKVEDTAASETNFSPENPPAESAFRTIVFTDIVGSTSLTQRLGDAAAMEILRTHNEIIRRALGEHSGSEVKHTGDGIMASFRAASAAVACSMDIQRAFRSREMEDPERFVRVRIGVSAGEPVMEHQDLFRASVQLAARICDHAEASSILVANVVRELCIGKGFTFEDSGEQALRGFEDGVRLFEVRWRD